MHSFTVFKSNSVTENINFQIPSQKEGPSNCIATRNNDYFWVQF